MAMQTYASKYVEITNMKSPIKTRLEHQFSLALTSDLQRTTLCGDELVLEFVNLYEGDFDDEDDPSEEHDTNAHQPEQYVCEGVGKNRTDEQWLFGKVAAWRTSEMDASKLIPNFEPQICVFAFEDSTFHDSPRVFEMYVREDYLKSPAGREFGQEVLRAKLKGELV